MKNQTLHIEPGKPLKTKLYTKRYGKRRPYYLCLLFNNAEELREFAREQSKLIRCAPPKWKTRRYWHRCTGVARRYTYFKWQSTLNVGCVLLCKEDAGAGVVSHEMTHAALYEVKKGNFPCKLTLADDEKLAWMQGYLVNQYWRWAWRLIEKQKDKHYSSDEGRRNGFRKRDSKRVRNPSKTRRD